MKNNKDIQIFLILSTKINEPNIVKNIINIIKNEEEKDALEYHVERWETIAGSFFQSIERWPSGDPHPYSFVLDGRKYIYEKDRNLSYFSETSVSYQCRELLLETIKNEALEFVNDKYIDNLTGESKEWREINDKMYSVLSKLINDSM
jgi:hypothetical protein